MRRPRAPAKRVRPARPARNVLDFRPGADAVVRADGRTFVVDRGGLYAPLEVDPDATPPGFVENVRALGPARAARMFEIVRMTPFLSPEGRRERLEALLASGVVRLSFEIVEESARAIPIRSRSRAVPR